MEKLVERIWSEESCVLEFHQKCLDQYVHPKSLDKLKRFKAPEPSSEESPSTSSAETPVRKSSRKRDRLGKKNFLGVNSKYLFKGLLVAKCLR